MTKSIEAIRQADGFWTIKSVETDVVLTSKDIIVPPPVVIPPTSEVLFYDDFSSMDLKNSMNGIFWSSQNRGSGDKYPVVTNDCLFNGKPSLKFTFGGGPPDDDAWSEQRFKFDKPISEVWIQFYRYYPSGKEEKFIGPKWVHRDAPGGDNNKILVLWGGEYGKYTITCGLSAWEDKAGHDRIYTTLGTNQLDGAGQRGTPSAPVEPESNLGRWVKMTFHVKPASVANNDGIVQFWQDDLIKIDNRALPLYPRDGIGNLFTEGYLMGWMNTGFAETTHCYIADVKISDKPI